MLVFLMDIWLPANALNCAVEDIVTSKLPTVHQLLVPKEYDKNRSLGYPVIYILSSEKLSDNKRNKIYDTFDNMISKGVIEPVIVVVVEVENTVIGDTKNIVLSQYKVIQEAINCVDKHYNSRSQPDGRLLIGGLVSTVFGLTHPELFKGIVTLNFPGLFSQNQWDEELVSRSIARYVEQSVRIPLFIIAGKDIEDSYPDHQLHHSQTEDVTNNIQAVQLYQQLHKANVFQKKFSKYNDVPANPAELRILYGSPTKNAWINGIEESLKFFFDYKKRPLAPPLYDPSIFQAANKGQVLTNQLSGETSLKQTPIKLSYKVYLPYAYNGNSDIKYPVLYLLHGSAGNETSWNEFWPILDTMIEQERIPPVVAIAPITGNSYWIDSKKYGPIESIVIQKLIPEVDAKYRTISQKSGRGIVGFSMGGYGALRYSLVYPKLFSSAVLLSPAIQHDDAPITSGAVTRGAFGEPFSLSKWNTLNYPVALRSYLSQKHRVPIYLITGDDDWNHISEKDDLPKDAHRYNMEVQAVTLQQQLTQCAEQEKAHCIPSQVQLSILNGGHDLDVWAVGFQQGIQFMFANGLSRSF
tara:strand:+ start:20650 stop:22392 length:1743 start_codon:yes stop_codon:yes gene_type:complete